MRVQVRLAEAVTWDDRRAVLERQADVSLALLHVDRVISALREHLLSDATDEDHDALVAPEHALRDAAIRIDAAEPETVLAIERNAEDHRCSEVSARHHG